MPNLYLKFLQNIASLEPIQLKHKDLSPTATLLLNEIAIKDFDEQPLTVSQVMELYALGSPANLHRKIYELHEAGLISLTNIGADRRTKYLFLTQAAKDYFQINSDAMLKALESI